jgi:hypothetical protein
VLAVVGLGLMPEALAATHLAWVTIMALGAWRSPDGEGRLVPLWRDEAPF